MLFRQSNLVLASMISVAVWALIFPRL